MRFTAGSVSGDTSGRKILYSRLSCTAVSVSAARSETLHRRSGTSQEGSHPVA